MDRSLEAILPLGAFAMFVWMVYLILEFFRRRHQFRMMTELHTKLLDRVGSASELTEFLNTPGGERFLGTLSAERAPVTGPHTRILRAVQVGIVLLVLGLGIMGFGAIHGGGMSRDAVNGLGFFDTLALSLGVGLLLSGWASYRLSKRMGLIGATDQNGPAAQ